MSDEEEVHGNFLTRVRHEEDWRIRMANWWGDDNWYPKAHGATIPILIAQATWLICWAIATFVDIFPNGGEYGIDYFWFFAGSIPIIGGVFGVALYLNVVRENFQVKANVLSAYENYSTKGSAGTAKSLSTLRNAWLGALVTLDRLDALYPELIDGVGPASKHEIERCHAAFQEVRAETRKQFDYFAVAFRNELSRMAVASATDVMVAQVRECENMYEVCSSLFVYSYVPPEHQMLIDVEMKAARAKLEGLLEARAGTEVGSGVEVNPKAAPLDDSPAPEIEKDPEQQRAVLEAMIMAGMGTREEDLVDKDMDQLKALAMTLSGYGAEKYKIPSKIRNAVKEWTIIELRQFVCDEYKLTASFAAGCTRSKLELMVGFGRSEAPKRPLV